MPETIGRPMEILLVEDALSFARLTMGVLKKGRVQHHITWIQDGLEAMEFLHREGKYKQAPIPDLILLDLGLPKLNGREVLQQARANPALTSIPIVIMTADTDGNEFLEEHNLQVEGYLVKPINLDQFLDLVSELKRFWHDDMIVPEKQDDDDDSEETTE